MLYHPSFYSNRAFKIKMCKSIDSICLFRSIKIIKELESGILYI